MTKICPLPKDDYKGDATFSCEADGYWMICTCVINALWLTAILFSSWRSGRVDEVRGSIFLHHRYWIHCSTIHCVSILLVLGCLGNLHQQSVCIDIFSIAQSARTDYKHVLCSRHGDLRRVGVSTIRSWREEKQSTNN